MATNLELDDKLIETARKLGGGTKPSVRHSAARWKNMSGGSSSRQSSLNSAR